MIATYAVRLVLLLAAAVVGFWLGTLVALALAVALSFVVETTELGWIVYVGGLFGAGVGIVAGGRLLQRAQPGGE